MDDKIYEEAFIFRYEAIIDAYDMGHVLRKNPDEHLEDLIEYLAKTFKIKMKVLEEYKDLIRQGLEDGIQRACEKIKSEHMEYLEELDKFEDLEEEFEEELEDL